MWRFVLAKWGGAPLSRPSPPPFFLLDPPPPPHCVKRSLGAAPGAPPGIKRFFQFSAVCISLWGWRWGGGGLWDPRPWCKEMGCGDYGPPPEHQPPFWGSLFWGAPRCFSSAVRVFRTLPHFTTPPPVFFIFGGPSAASSICWTPPLFLPPMDSQTSPTNLLQPPPPPHIGPPKLPTLPSGSPVSPPPFVHWPPKLLPPTIYGPPQYSLTARPSQQPLCFVKELSLLGHHPRR